MKRASVPYSIWALGMATFLINSSSVIVFGLSAVYMKTMLGVHTGLIGFLEGAVEACAYIMKLVSGILSDYMRKRKSIMVLGFALATIARPILALYSTFSSVFVARILDRIGNGVQATPRDALIGDLSPEEIKGTCYGLRQALATAGSVFGGFLGVCAMVWTKQDFQLVFWVASIPAVLGLLVLCFFVKDAPATSSVVNSSSKLSFSDLKRLEKPFWWLMVIAGVFMLARVSEAMLILHAHQNHGLTQSYTPLILILYNGSNSLASYPIGRLSDRFPRHYLLVLGFMLLICADLLLAFASSLWLVMLGVVIWGMQIGITQSMFLTLVADTVPVDLRGTGFGFFYLITAIALLLASTLGGSIAHTFGEASMFLASAGIGGVAIVLLLGTIILKK